LLNRSGTFAGDPQENTVNASTQQDSPKASRSDSNAVELRAIAPHAPEAIGAARGLRAVILAGGRGVRLRPFTVNFPKPLVPLGDTPVVEVLLEKLLAAGVSDVTMTLGHLADLMRAYFSQRTAITSRLNLRFVQESEPTGTAGSLRTVPGLDQTFLVMNGDLLTDLDFDDLVHHHRKQGAALTIATHRRHVKVDLGVLELGNGDRVVGYREKPEMFYEVSMGIYVFEPRVLDFIEPGKFLDFPDLVLRLIDAGLPVSGYRTNCLWLDIGRPDDYARAQELFAEKQKQFERV
jgi:NDP-sugar pyrophosphorylase family protein